MTLKRVFGIVGDRVRVGPDEHTNPITPSEELQLYVGNGGTVLALTPEQVALRNGDNTQQTNPQHPQPLNTAQLPLGYQQEPSEPSKPSKP